MNKRKVRSVNVSYRERLRCPGSLTARSGEHCPIWIALTISRRAIQTGQCAPDLAVRDSGPLSHSRWMTCAIRVLRLFISQTSPTSELKMVVNYIVKTYSPVWFTIKRYLSVKYGPTH
ncbi:hypothetical protein AVEN_128493-1 [Araneus ventricosus]|uniref:Uncharacterized protein n=1 Tax=Araneus ventricosus TaxID=182803 RepID=A0A4Y2FRP8_ARAVE|nr:hypothetical protein AVEN_128493-1 [Araneus ventricosus]